MTLNFSSSASAATPFGSLTVGPFNVTGTIQPQVNTVNLVSGNNSVSVPTNAVGVIITPPSANAVVLKYKTTAGDTGLNIPQGAPSVFIFDTLNAPTSIIVNAASGTTGNTEFLFF